MSKKHIERLLEARSGAPDEIRGLAFDAWVLVLVLDSLSPAEQDTLKWILAQAEVLCTNDLCVAAHTTPTRIGATLTRLRRFGLIKTYYGAEADGLRRAYHTAALWVQRAWQEAGHDS